MSYDPSDAAWDDMWDRMSQELYPEHRKQAIAEFTADRLRSFYLSNPMVMHRAVEALQEAKRLKANGHSSAAVVFCVTAIELLLKATLLQPIVHGLVHNAGLADVIVKHALGQAGFDRYQGLLSRLFQELAGLDLTEIGRDGEKTSLIDECKKLQNIRNDIVHKGLPCDVITDGHAIDVAVAVYEKVVMPVLWSLDLTVVEQGRIERRQFT
jgi:HEPN domain-containing protein